MGSIYHRLDTQSAAWRVQIRRKDIPKLSIVFSTKKEAQEWVAKNEFKYINDPQKYLLWIKEERLNLRRKREFRNILNSLKRRKKHE